MVKFVMILIIPIPVLSFFCFPIFSGSDPVSGNRDSKKPRGTQWDIKTEEIMTHIPTVLGKKNFSMIVHIRL